MTLIRNVAGLALLTAHFAARAAKEASPRPTFLHERLNMVPARDVPLDHPVDIHWNAHQVPFIEAASDTDLATTLGLVHAHLRMAQMEILRRLSQGRLSELVGPIALDLDHLLRILDFGRAVPEMLEGLPEDTRQWLEAYVCGINHYLRHLPDLPHEFAVLNLEPEPWSGADVLRIGRLAAADVNWMVWVQLLGLRGRKGWPALWSRLVANGTTGEPGPAAASDMQSPFAAALRPVARWASNAAAVSARRSATGGALIASDPHLPLQLPGPWLIAGYKSPSYHSVGLMAPALPFIAIGRNPWIAWGGTNLHAASSDLYDVSDLPPNAITERREVIKVRWWPDRSVILRDTPLGPIISDARLLGLDRRNPIALRWMGHRPSDELSAMLRLNRARDWEGFRAAIDGVSVPGQTMIYADVTGRVGRATAAHLPERREEQLQGLLLESRSTGHWRRLVSGNHLPAELDPPEGFVASANERPDHTAVPVGVFFSPPDRARRLSALIGAQGDRTAPEGLKAVLNDVYEATSHKLCQQFSRALSTSAAVPAAMSTTQIEALLAEWDGRYETGSQGALAFELVFENFVRAFYGRDKQRAYWATWTPRSLVLEDLLHAETGAVASTLRRAIRRSVRPFARFADWGEMHRLRLGHPFSLVPIFGRRYIVSDRPAAGSNETLNKTAHRPGSRRHAAFYGSGARQVSDLSDLDHNDFVLLGGQDGWLGSANQADQLPLWQQGAYLRIPLRLTTVHECFAHRTHLLPWRGRGGDPS